MKSLLLAAGVAIVAMPALAQNKIAATVPLMVKTAKLKLMAAGKEISLLPGKLFLLPLLGNQAHLADVNDKGELDQPYRCSPGDRLLGVPSGELLLTGDNKSKPCADAVEFRYQSTKVVTLDTVSADKAASMGDYLKAYSDMAIMYSNAAGQSESVLKSNYTMKARASETAVIAVTMAALGDDKLDRYVLRDPAQGYKLALTAAGVDRLKVFQQENNLPVTGHIDFKTMTEVGKLEAPALLRAAGGGYKVLPSKWLQDEVVMTSPYKSAALVELSMQAKER